MTARGGRSRDGSSRGDERCRILVVDDEPTIVFSITRYLGARGFQMEGAFERAGAVHLLRQTSYELVIADLRLEGPGDVQGLEILDFARAQGPETRTVLLTAYATDQVRNEAVRRCVDVVLRKPVALPDLAQVVMCLVASPS